MKEYVPAVLFMGPPVVPKSGVVDYRGMPEKTIWPRVCHVVTRKLGLGVEARHQKKAVRK